MLLSAAFVRENNVLPAAGTLSLYINDEKVGEGKIITQPGNFSLVGEGLNVGIDPGVPVTGDYAGTAPYKYTGGKIFRVIVDVSGEPYVDFEMEAQKAFARD
jgi:arylsulfatase